MDSLSIRNVSFLISILAVLALLGCSGGGGGGANSNGGTATSISANATTTAQSLTVSMAMTSFSPLMASGGATPYRYSYSGSLPAGLIFNASTGAVTGTPNATFTAGNVVFSVQDANGVVANTTSTVIFTVGAASPSINATPTTTMQSLTVGTAMASFSPLMSSGGATPYTYSITSGALPAGLSLNTSTGAVTGIPTTPYTTANVVFSVHDANGVVANTTSTVSFTVTVPSVSISATATTTAQNLTVGTAMASLTPLTPSGGATPYLFSYAGTLPAGINFDTSTGVLTGIPSTLYTTANVVFSVQDVNGVVANTTSTVSFTVIAAPPSISATADTSAQNLIVGATMASFYPLTANGGTLPYNYTISSGRLPSGLVLDYYTGAVTGILYSIYPTADVVFSVQDANGVVAGTTSTVSFTVTAPPISAVANTTAQNLTALSAMASFSPLLPMGGTPPYTYRLLSGTLPTGLNLSSSTGAVTGIPQSSYPTANLVFSVRDAGGVVASTTSTVSFSVNAQFIPSANVTTTVILTDGVPMVSFSPISVFGGTPPYTYTINSLDAALPPGLSLNAITGAVTGIPGPYASTSNVFFSVHDANGVFVRDVSSVRFVVAEAGVVYQGGLSWMPEAAISYSYAGATALCSYTFFGMNGWRLPTLTEVNAFYTAYPNNTGSGSGLLLSMGWTLARTWTSTSSSIGVNYVVDLNTLFQGLASTSIGSYGVTCVL